MKDVFVADAHLADPDAENFHRFLDFLDGLHGQTRTLFLLGDIFEFWVGYRHVVFAPYVPVLDALRRLKEAGTEIVYVEGNHDFHLGPWFEKTLGARILPDGGEVTVDGQRLLVVHGDLIDPSDSGYRLLRRLLRSRPFRVLKSLIPPDWAWAIARWGSRQSQKKHSSYNRSRKVEEMVSSYGEKKLAEGFDGVVSGHFHTAFIRPSDSGTIVALGDWIDQYSYAVLEDGVFTLESY
ncbi:MAG: UDP-2,3-diacylglucosamine diphosphatase [Desulfuromonadales bacterium]|nr:UDP-2,3-diacylglucosamine diphosphatase [Desulfuromonadales bacterium]NIR34330.1 UDP-2,3-diacylglucosamine diphosphatase [Desulfuromonadales bacterium]NIS41764.1 UDP-2,3-diacylglucosamine diphosphatase [Desulfuromonadales bacterium]